MPVTQHPSLQNIRYAIMGSGAIADVHATAIRATAGATLVAVWSRNQAAGERFAATFDCDYVSEYEMLLRREDIDAIAITTPGGAHASYAIAAAKAGKHVLVEKPIEISTEHADSIITACRDCNVQLGAIFQYRYGEGAQMAKRAADAGRFGRIVQACAYVPWLRKPEYFREAPWRANKALAGGGALMNQAIHAVDLLLWLAGDVAEVSAVVDNRVHTGVEVEDNVAAWLKFRCGALGLLQASTCCYPGESKRVEIKGDMGSVTLQDDLPVLWEFAGEVAADDFQALRLIEPHRVPEDTEANLGYNGARDARAISAMGHCQQYAAFTYALQTGTELDLPGSEGRRSIALIEAVYTSAEAGGSVVRL